MTTVRPRRARRDGRSAGSRRTSAAEAAGDWKPLADMYTEDATYGWNYGPQAGFHGRRPRRDPRTRARAGDGRPRRVAVPVPAVRRSTSAPVTSSACGSRSRIATRDDGEPLRGSRHRRQLVPLRRRLPVVLAARLLRLRQRLGTVRRDDHRTTHCPTGMQQRIQRSISGDAAAGLVPCRHSRRFRCGEPETRTPIVVRGALARATWPCWCPSCCCAGS